MSETAAMPARPPVALHAGIDVRRFMLPLLLSLIFPLTGGVILFGWRAIACVVIVVLAALIGMAFWRRIGRRGGGLRRGQVVWMALLMALALPAHLAAVLPVTGGAPPWPLLVVAGLLVPAVLWLGSGLPPRRIHPVALIALLLMLAAPQITESRFVLQRSHALGGDVLAVDTPAPPPPQNKPWAVAEPITDAPALVRSSPARQLARFTRGEKDPQRPWVSLDELIRDRLPPLEDLIIGGQPAPIGTASAVAIIMGGLFLLYRGLIDFRVPLLTVLSAYVLLLVLPIPVIVTESGPHWRWIAGSHPSVSWSSAITFVNYELLAGPLLFVAFFLATAPAVSPMSRRGRAMYAILLGALAAMTQLYASVEWGPYLALLAVSILVPLLDRLFRPRPLV